MFWLSTPEGPVKIVTPAQTPLFFIDKQDTHNVSSVLRDAGVACQIKSLPLKTFSGQSVSAVYFNNASQLYRGKELLRVAQITCFESDIRLIDRFLMERFISAGVVFSGQPQATKSQGQYTYLNEGKLKPFNYYPEFSVVSLDIECSDKGELYSIGLAQGDVHQVIMIGAEQPGPDWIVWVADEQALLNQLIVTMAAWDPDIIIGWNVINFDFRVLLERAKHCQVKLKLGRDGYEASWRETRNDSNNGFVSIPGRLVIDGIDSLKTATYQFDSFSLEFVAQSLLGKGKQAEDVDNRLAAITHDFLHDKVKLARYNIQDCVLVQEIFSHTNLLDFLILRSQLTGLELDRMGGSVAAFINVYLPKLHRAGYISPNRPFDGGLASPGGYVMNSRPGLYHNVLVLDFKSLYPSIIRTFKIDPLGLVEGLLNKENAITGYRGAMFSREKHFLPDIITSLWKQRDEAKKHKDAARSQAIKILMNSFYGVLGSGGCPFYDTRLASSITLRGHDIMQSTAAWIEQAGYQVIYGDTDSTFVWLEGVTSNEQAYKIGRQLEQQINLKWQQVLHDEFDLECHLEIEFETLFTTFLMPTIRGSEMGSKKRYAGMTYDTQGQSTLIFKGLETVRSDWTKLAKDFQRKLYEMVFAHQDVKDYTLRIIEDIRAGKYDQQLVYRKRLRQRLDNYTKNVPPHVKAARIADENNHQIGQPLRYQSKGWINYVITIDGPQPIEYQTSALDYEHYIDKQIRPIAEGILPFIDESFEQITSAQLGLF